MGKMTDFIFLGSKITAYGDGSPEIKMLAPWKKIYDKRRQHIKKQRHYIADKGTSSQSYGFSVVMYGCESWTIKKAECQRIDAFKLWCWRRLLRVPWTARGYNQSILKEINPECSLEGLMLKLKLQSFGHLMRRTDSLEKTLMLGKIEQEEKGTTEDEMVGSHHPLDGPEFEQGPGPRSQLHSLAVCPSFQTWSVSTGPPDGLTLSLDSWEDDPTPQG